MIRIFDQKSQDDNPLDQMLGNYKKDYNQWIADPKNKRFNLNDDKKNAFYFLMEKNDIDAVKKAYEILLSATIEEVKKDNPCVDDITLRLRARDSIFMAFDGNCMLIPLITEDRFDLFNYLYGLKDNGFINNVTYADKHGYPSRKRHSKAIETHQDIGQVDPFCFNPIGQKGETISLLLRNKQMKEAEFILGWFFEHGHVLDELLEPKYQGQMGLITCKNHDSKAHDPYAEILKIIEKKPDIINGNGELKKQSSNCNKEDSDHNQQSFFGFAK